MYMLYVFIAAMVMADVTVITEMMQEEEKRIKAFLEGLGQKLKDKKVTTSF